MFLASQLTEISNRFPGHVQDIREFLLKEKLRVPSPEAIPELSSRLESDPRFRADVASLVRAALYREREQVGYEELLGILVAAAGGTERDLTSESQEASIRAMLRFLLQSRRSMYRPEPEEAEVAAEPEPREPARVDAEPVDAEPVRAGARLETGARLQTGAARWAVESVKREPKLMEGSVAVAELEERDFEERQAGERDSGRRGFDEHHWGEREAADVMLPFRTAGLFAAQTEPESSWWRTHAMWVVGIVAMLVGIGAGLGIRRGVPATNGHVAAPTQDAAVSQGKTVGATSAKQSPVKGSAGAKSKMLVPARGPAPASARGLDAAASGVGAGNGASAAGMAQAAPVRGDDRAQAGAPGEAATAAQPAGAEESVADRVTDGAVPAHSAGAAAVPMTVVKQVVRASEDDEVESEPTPTTAATHSIVHQGSAGMMPANVIFSPPPEYPAAASAARVQGEVTVRAVVDPDGNVIYARAVAGPPVLRDAAREAVQRWRYRPLLYYGKPIAVTTTAILDFKIAK